MASKNISVALKGVKVLGVTSPETIQKTALRLGINPQEVYVSLTFETAGKEYTAKNKLSFIGKEDYVKLLEREKDGELLNITISKSDYVVDGELREDYYFYVDLDKEVSVDELFTTPVAKKDTRTSLSSLLK